MNQVDVILKEYEALRNEILAYFSRENARLSLVWAGVGVIIGAAVYSGLSELAFLSLLLALLGWWEHLVINASVHKIGSYIEVNLESQINGLNWQGVVRAVDGRYAKADWPTRRKLVSALSSPHGLTSLICALAVAILVASDPANTSWQITARIVLVLICAAFFVAAVCRDFDRHSQSKKWTEAFRCHCREHKGDFPTNESSTTS